MHAAAAQTAAAQGPLILAAAACMIRPGGAHSCRAAVFLCSVYAYGPFIEAYFDMLTDYNQIVRLLPQIHAGLSLANLFKKRRARTGQYKGNRDRMRIERRSRAYYWREQSQGAEARRSEWAHSYRSFYFSRSLACSWCCFGRLTRLRRETGRRMWILLAISAGVMVYLTYVIFNPEKF
ncbi:MAG: potassium-transporting ATPase subunit F [Bacilli bacterium]